MKEIQSKSVSLEESSTSESSADNRSSPELGPDWTQTVDLAGFLEEYTHDRFTLRVWSLPDGFRSELDVSPPADTTDPEYLVQLEYVPSYGLEDTAQTLIAVLTTDPEETADRLSSNRHMHAANELSAHENSTPA